MMSNGQKNSAETHPVSGANVEADFAPAESRRETLKVVTCPVCRAVYVPSLRPGGSSDAPTLLESAFLCVCHFCLHCQRPSCPQCWDAGQHLCASCCASERVAFRPSLASFVGLTFSAPALPQSHLPGCFSFICLRDGHVEGLAEEPQPAPTRQVSRPAAFAYPDWLQEIMGLAGDTVPAEHARSLALPLPEQVSAQLPRIEAQVSTPPVQLCDTPGEQPAEVGLFPDQLPASRRRADSVIERVENILLVLTSLCLTIIVLMIILALRSASLNMLLFSILHIDIRSEVTYLLQLI